VSEDARPDGADADAAPEEAEAATEPEPSGDGRGGKGRRRGCGCLLRGPVYLLLLVVVLVAGAYLWLQGEGARERAARLLEARLSEYFGRDVRVGDVQWSLFPITVEGRDLVIPNPEGWPADDPPFARVPRVVVHLELENWADWRDPVLDVQQVFATRPQVYLGIREDGSNNLPRFGVDREPSRRRIEVHLGALVAEEGVFRFNELELPLDFRARAVFARLQGVDDAGTAGEGPDAGLSLEGLVTSQEVEITLPDGKPYPLTVSAKARMGARRIDFQEVLLRGEDLRARTEGVLYVPEDERRLELDVSAYAQVALASHLGYLDPEEPPAQGPVRFDGDLLWRPEGWSVTGRLTSSRLTLADRVLTDVDGILRLRPESLRYDVDYAAYAGGTVSGVIAAELPADPRPFEVDLTVDGLDLEALVADQGLPLEGVHGRVRGEVSYRFTTDAPEDGSGWADLQLVSARQGVLSEGVALSGQVPLEIDRGIVRTRAVRLVSASGSQVVGAEGFYDVSEGVGEFRWNVATSDLGQLADLIPVEEEVDEDGEPAGRAPWLPTAGSGEIEGVLRLRPERFGVEAAFHLTTVEAPGLVADRLEGSAEVSALGVTSLRLQAASGGGALMVTGSVPFEEGVGRVPFELAIEAADWPSDERLAAWLPFELPVDGPISGHLELAGSTEALSGRAELTVEPAEVAGFPVDLVLADLTFDPEQVVVERGLVRAEAGDVTGRGTLDLVSGEMDFRIEAPGLDLDREPFAELLSGDGSGTLDLSADLEGTLERPRARARLASQGLTFAGRPLVPEGAEADRSAVLEVAWDGEEVRADGGIGGLITLEGGGALTPERADLRFAVASERLGEVARLVTAGVPPEIDGALSGDLVVAGDLSAPGELRVALELLKLELRYQDHTLENLEPVVVRYTGDALAVDSLFLREAETESEIFAQGTIGLAEPNPLDLRFQGSVSTDWVELVAPAVDLEGTFDVLATVRGTVHEPRLNGQGELRDGTLGVEGLPQTLEDLSAVVLFYPQQVVIDRLRAHMGGGSLQASGRVGLFGPAGLDYDLQASLDNVTLRYPEGFWLRGDAALSLLSTPDGRLLRGSVELERAYYVKDVEVGLLQLLRGALRAQRLEVAETGELESSTRLSLTVRAPGTVRVRNNLADLTGSADLVVRGSLARPVVFGEVALDRGGTLVYAENEFEVERARLSFVSSTRIDPIIDLVATTDVREYDITLTLSGRVESLQARVASDPPLSDLDVVALLTTGQTPGDRGPIPGISEAGSATAATAAERFLYGQAASLVSERLETLFGFDTLRISPVVSESGGAIGSVTVGKRLSSTVLVTYTSQPTATEEFLVQVEWQVNEHLTLIFTSIEGDAYRVDARWDKRF
jgi:translocation and assembly module TamB